MNNPPEAEYYTFGKDNKLRVFSPNTFNFKPKDHILLDEVQQCLLDNLWYQYNNKKEDKGYFLAILNSLSEYFNKINGMIPPSNIPGRFELKPLYVIYNGSRPGIYLSYEEIIIVKRDLERRRSTASFVKYMNIDKALEGAQKVLGPNYYMEPAAREYIENYSRLVGNNNKTSEEISIEKIKVPVGIREEGSTSKKISYEESMKKEVTSPNDECIERKINEKLERISSAWKENIKKEIQEELKKEMNEKLEELKKEINERMEELKRTYEDKYTNEFLDEDIMDIGGHGQLPESEQN